MIARMIRYQALHTCSVLRWYDEITSTEVRDDTIVDEIKGKIHGSKKDISPSVRPFGHTSLIVCRYLLG